MTSSSRILISGYYGFGNVGDEAILAGLLEGIRRLDAQADVIVLSGDPGATIREHHVAAVPRRLLSVRQQLATADLLISGGGGLLQDVTSWRSPLYYLGVIHLARSARVPIACIGHGVGPLRRGPIRALARRVLAGVDLIAVRDEGSRAALRALGLAHPIALGADLAFLLPSPDEAEIAAARRRADLPDDARPTAAIALRPPAGRALAPDLAERLGRAVGRACADLGLLPVLIPMHAGLDARFARAAAAASPTPAHVVPSPVALHDALALVAGCQLVIAARLHALVFAALGGVPAVPISYDPKVDALADQLGIEPATTLADSDARALSAGITGVWEQRDRLGPSLRGRADDLRAVALSSVEAALAVRRSRRPSP